MKIFLDTDTLSYFFKGNEVVREKITAATNNNDEICLTCINVYEVIKGLRYKGTVKQVAEFENFLNHISVYPFDNESIKTAGSIYSALRKQGITIGDADIIIASIVMTNDGFFITNNIKHYENINGLKTENWIN